MLLLLPPSEGKTPAPDGAPPVSLDALTSPVLTAHREAVLDALVRVSGRPDALDVLGVSPGLAAEVARNTGLRTAAAAPAAQVYTGVLYAAAGLTSLDETATARAAESVRIVSALWGALSPADRVPAYRLSMGTSLPDVGPLAAAWRPHLAHALDERAASDVVVDCRSATYVAAWKPPRDSDWVAVKVLREVAGRRSVVSHHAKHTRGVLAHHLLTRDADVTTPDDLLKAADELVGTELLDANLLPAARGAATLELVVADPAPAK